MIRDFKVYMLVFAAAALLTPISGTADTPGRHPRYLKARSDRRVAQMLSRVREEENVMRNLRRCDEEIEAAIHEIDQAARFDRKDLDDHPRIDAHVARSGRF